MRKRENYLLDSTLRHLYDTISNQGVLLVAIEFKYHGTIWRVDTPEEAVALRNRLATEDKAYLPIHEEMDEKSKLWTPDKFVDAINAIGDLQEKLLMEVSKTPRITSGQLVKLLGVDSDVALAGIISGLSKQLKRVDIELRDVLVIEIKWTGKTKTRRFILDDFFVYAGTEQNWPEGWEKRKSGVKRRRELK